MGKSSGNSTDEERQRTVAEAIQELSIHNYSYESMLGNGSYGDVIKVYDTESGTYKAAKVITKNNVEEKEIALWPVLDHENVLPLEKTLTLTSKSVVFISPLLLKSFDEIICDKRFTSFEHGYVCTRRWLVDALNGLVYMHKNNICHLDLKLDNVLISCEGVARICDFSFINVSDELMNRGHIGLPAMYRPPEMYKKKVHRQMDGTKVDVWAYGMMAVEAFTLEQMYNRLDGCKLWSRDVRPLLQFMLEESVFTLWIKNSFPLHNFAEGEISDALDFVGCFLNMIPSKRITASEALEHAFVNRATSVTELLTEIFPGQAFQRTVDEENARKWDRKYPTTPGFRVSTTPYVPEKGSGQLFDTSDEDESDRGFGSFEKKSRTRYFKRADNDVTVDTIIDLMSSFGVNNRSSNVDTCVSGIKHEGNRESLDSSTEDDALSEDDGETIPCTKSDNSSDVSETTSDGLMSTTGPRGNGKTDATDSTPSQQNPISGNGVANKGQKKNMKLKVLRKKFRMYRFNPLPAIFSSDRQRFDGAVRNKGDDRNVGDKQPVPKSKYNEDTSEDDSL